MAKAKRSAFPGTRKGALDKRAMEVEDPAWRSWFLEVARRRAELEDAKKKPFVVSTFEWDGEERTVGRQKSEPTPLKKLVKETTKSFGVRLADDLEAVRTAWAQVSGSEIAAETAFFSLRAGILTIEVFSGVLLQELRQFQKDALVKDLRDIWPATVPLVELKFKPGKR